MPLRIRRTRHNRAAAAHVETRIFVADRDYIPSGTADMWNLGKRRAR